MTANKNQVPWTPGKNRHFNSYNVIDMAQRLIEREVNLDDHHAVTEVVLDEYFVAWDQLVLEEFVRQSINAAKDFSRPSDIELWTEGVAILRRMREAEKQRRESCHERGDRCAWEPYTSSELDLWIKRYCGGSRQARHWWDQYWRAAHNPVWLASKARMEAGQAVRNDDDPPQAPTPKPGSEVAERLWPLEPKLLDCTCYGKGFIWEKNYSCVGRERCPECGNHKMLVLALVGGELVGELTQGQSHHDC
jgi:hypothetical protein